MLENRVGVFLGGEVFVLVLFFQMQIQKSHE